MSEQSGQRLCLNTIEVGQPFPQQLVLDHHRSGPGATQDPSRCLRQTLRQWILPGVFAKPVSAINTTAGGEQWVTPKQKLRR